MMGFLVRLLLKVRPSLTENYARILVGWGLTAIAVLVLLFVYSWHNHQVKRAVERGATTQRETDLRATIERMETGNEARDEIQRELRDGVGYHLYHQCLRTARTPANCQRFLSGD